MVRQANRHMRALRDYSFWLRMVMLGVSLLGCQFFMHVSSARAAAAHIQPNVSIDASIRITTGSSLYRIGSTVTYAAVVTTSAASLTLTDSTPINVSILLPIGLMDVTVDGGSTWAINSTATTSPSIITASYTDTYPIVPGTTLPPVTITGIVGASNSATYSTIASLFVPGDNNSANDSSTCTFAISTPLSMPGTIDAAIRITSPRTSYTIGETARYTAEVSTTPASGICSAGTPLNITMLFPLGLKGIIADSSSTWSINVSATTSPTIITASYRGSYPIIPGTMLRPIRITGIVDAPANATYVSTANLTVPGDIDSANDFSIYTFTVLSPFGPTKNPINAPIKAPQPLATTATILKLPELRH